MESILIFPSLSKWCLIVNYGEQVAMFDRHDNDD